MDLRCRLTIESPQQTMQVSGAPLSRPRPQPLAQFVGPLRSRKQPFQQCAQIETGPANHDRKMSAPCNLSHRSPRLPRILTRSEPLTGLGDIDQVMRNASAIFTRRLGGADLEVPIHRNRIATDNLA